MNKEQIIKALAELRKNEKRKFEQTIDLIVNLKNFDLKKNSLNIFADIPYKIKEKRVCGFLTKKSDIIDTITKPEIELYKDKKKAKKLVKQYDFFIAHMSLMPAIANTLGRVMGPSGKMPSPQLGVLTDDSDNSIKALLVKIEKAVKIKAKEPSVKIAIAKENMKDDEIAENILSVYNAIMNALPNKKENIRSVLIKFTMTKPIKLE